MFSEAAVSRSYSSGSLTISPREPSPLSILARIEDSDRLLASRSSLAAASRAVSVSS